MSKLLTVIMIKVVVGPVGGIIGQLESSKYAWIINVVVGLAVAITAYYIINKIYKFYQSIKHSQQTFKGYCADKINRYKLVFQNIWKDSKAATIFVASSFIIILFVIIYNLIY